MLGIEFCNFQRVCFCACLFFLSACETGRVAQEEENIKTITLTLSDLIQNDEAITVADFTWDELDNGDWHFTVEFTAKEGTSSTTDGKPFKNMPITIYYILPINKVKAKPEYRPEIKPIKHQKIKITYLKNEPGLMFNILENIKCLDKHGRIVELS